MKNEKCYSIFNGERQAYKCRLFEKFDLHNKSSWTIHFLAGVICIDCISIEHVTLFWLVMDFSLQKWYNLLCLTGKSGLSVHPFWKDWISLTRSMRSRVQLKLLSLNSKLSVRENWLIVLVNFSFSCGCDSWINRFYFLRCELGPPLLTSVKDILHYEYVLI